MSETKILPLRYWNDPILSNVCEPIADSGFGAELEEFGRQLLATMNAKNGVGLAAPQVGVANRVFAMAFPDHQDREPIVVCNPELVLKGSTVFGREGCLSLPGIYQQVYRASASVVRYRKPDGTTAELDLTLWDARVAQHEFDHLNGIMFFNYLDKREEFGTDERGQPWRQRMTKQMCKSVLREWDKVRDKYGND
jgi:peptide deformylase